MKTLRNILLIAGTTVLVFALLVRLIPASAYGFIWAAGGIMLLGGLVILASPLYCRKDKEEKPAEPKK